MKIKIITIFVLILLFVGLLFVRDYKKTIFETYKTEDKCAKSKSCKKCLNIGICGWSTDNNTCIPIPQNATGVILNKDDCLDIYVEIDNVSQDNGQDTTPQSSTQQLQTITQQAQMMQPSSVIIQGQPQNIIQPSQTNIPTPAAVPAPLPVSPNKPQIPSGAKFSGGGKVV